MRSAIGLARSVTRRDIDELRLDQRLGDLSLLLPELGTEDTVAKPGESALDTVRQSSLVFEGEGWIAYKAVGLCCAI